MSHPDDPNPDPRCSCIHPASMHDPETGACLATNPVFGPCPCTATSKAARGQLDADHQAHPADPDDLRALYSERRVEDSNPDV